MTHAAVSFECLVGCRLFGCVCLFEWWIVCGSTTWTSLKTNHTLTTNKAITPLSCDTPLRRIEFNPWLFCIDRVPRAVIIILSLKLYEISTPFLLYSFSLSNRVPPLHENLVGKQLDDAKKESGLEINRWSQPSGSVWVRGPRSPNRHQTAAHNQRAAPVDTEWLLLNLCAASSRQAFNARPDPLP